MKILVGFCADNPPPQWEFYKSVFGILGDEVRLFGNLGGDVVYHPGMMFEEILQGIPDFHPDLVVLYNVEYWAVPRNLEQFDGIVTAVIGDWNLNTHGVLASQVAIDYNFTDKSGVEFLKTYGITAEYFPMFFHDPNRMYPDPNIRKDYDIVFAGNMASAIQAERNRWLYRIVKLSEKYKIGIFPSIFGDDYVNILRRGKIIFNRSIRKEMNMRAFEAPACGSLLFYDEENLEVRDFFQDRIHCVLYNEKNLEDLLDYYLTHEEEREKIQEAGLKKVQEYVYPERIKNLLKRFHELPKGVKRRKDIFKVKDLYLDLSQLYSPGTTLYIGENKKNLVEVNNQCALIAAASHQRDQNTAILKWCGEALKRLALENTNNIMIQFNTGWCLKEAGNSEEGLFFLLNAFELLKKSEILDEGLIPILPRYSYFFVRWHQTFWEGPSIVLFKQKNLIHEQLCFLIGSLYEEKNDFEKAEEFYRNGISQNFESHPLLKSLGDLLSRRGEFKEAYSFYQQSHKLNPHDLSLWLKMIHVLKQFDKEKAGEFLDQKIEALSAFPRYSSFKERLCDAYFGKRLSYT